MMLSRLKNRFLRSPLLLPALLFALTFRGAIPVGYMPVATDGGLRIVMCSGVIVTDTGAQRAPAPTTGSTHDDTSPCPFAASALPPLPISMVFGIAAAPVVPVLEPRAQSAAGFTLVRAQLPRAPPLSRQIKS